MSRRILFAVGLLAGLANQVGCYNPELAPAPFLCGKGGACPDGYSCYGGICMDSEPACMTEVSPVHGWYDADFEPNNYPELAVPLSPQCWQAPEDGYDICQCPPFPTKPGYRRAPYSNGTQTMAICPQGDRDFYKIWLDQGEILRLTLEYRYALGRNLDLYVHRKDGDHYSQVGASTSSNDDEYLEIQATVPGYYFVEVRPNRNVDEYDSNGQIVRPADIGDYILKFDLNPYGCNKNNICDAYETHESCPDDCTDIVCGNLVCENGETPGTCAQDCACGNGVCEPTENPTTCPDDCTGC